MQKKQLRRLVLSRETITRLDVPTLAEVNIAGASSQVCCTGITSVTGLYCVTNVGGSLKADA